MQFFNTCRKKGSLFLCDILHQGNPDFAHTLNFTHQLQMPATMVACTNKRNGVRLL